MLNSILIYGTIALSTSIFAECSVKIKNKCFNYICIVMTFLIPVFFAGVRYGIGTDYFVYKSIFENIGNGINVKQEIGFKFINYLIYRIGGNVQVVFFVISFLTILFIYLSLLECRTKISVGLGMFIFMLLYYQCSFNAVRQVLAISITLYSVKYIFKRSFIKFLLFILIASSIHLSAIVLFPFYFIYSIIVGKKYLPIQIFFIIVFFIAVLNYNGILSPLIANTSFLETYGNYLQTKEQYSFGIGVIVLSLPYILPGILFFRDLYIYENNFMLYYSFLIIGAILNLTVYFGGEFVSRISMNFLITTIIVVPYYVRIFKYKRLRILGVLLIMFIIGIWIYESIYLGYNQTVPYEWIYSY